MEFRALHERRGARVHDVARGAGGYRQIVALHNRALWCEAW